ncbi:MAG: sulfurtransferase [Gemmatimonadota bacterium]
MSGTLPPVTPIAERGYSHPDVLVDSTWVAAHLNDPKVRLFEANEDLLFYETGHIPGAVKIDWLNDLNDAVVRDFVGPEALQRFLRVAGVDRDTTLVLYGDKNNWWATYAFWVFQLFGLANIKLLDGGRLRWAEEGRLLVTEKPTYPGGDVLVGPRADIRVRALRHDVEHHIRAKGKLVDVRSPEEYRGERLHMPDYPNEGALRGGHIPGAKSIPWAKAVDPATHTYRPAVELRTLYEQEQGFTKDDDVVVYCRIGERSSHSWFALTYLLGYGKVRNYDGSWTEWGNSVGVPIEK